MEYSLPKDYNTKRIRKLYHRSTLYPVVPVGSN